MKRQFLALLAGALGGTLLAYWFREADELLTGAGLGALVAIIVVNLDGLLDLGITGIKRISSNRYWLAVAGGTLGAGLALALCFIVLGSIGWVGSCWG